MSRVMKKRELSVVRFESLQTRSPHAQSLKKVNEPGHEKMGLMSYANNKGAFQPRIRAI